MADSKSINTAVYDENWVMGRRNPNHGLLPVRTVLKNCGNPHDEIRTIHVAGTNGKGSTCNYLKDILMSQGYRVGMFTSPHLIEHRDRIRINDEFISGETFNAYLRKHAEEFESMNMGMFEIDTCIAFEWFRDQKVDYAIMECGLGGRLDNTNVIAKPELCIITTTAFDHTAILGNRIEQIAFEKAGITVPYGRTLISELPEKAERIVRLHAYRKHAAVIEADRYYPQRKDAFAFRNDVYEIGSTAGYQFHNASLALMAASLLGVDIHSDAVHHAIKRSGWAGRFERVSEKPLVIVDGAHNEEGIRALCDSVGNLPHPLVCVFSALRDKPGRKMASMLSSVCDHLIVTQFEYRRADTAEDLTVEGAEVDENWVSAIERAEIMAGDNGCVLISGSLYFISKVRKKYK